MNHRTMEGETPLLLACMLQNNTKVACILLEHGANVDMGNNESHTPLHAGTAEFLVSCSNLYSWYLNHKMKKSWILLF